MARKSRSRRKTSATRTKDSKESLSLDVKVGILHTIANAIYPTAAGKLREAVANALDNNATWIIVVVDQTNASLSILDNGTGITREKFQEICKSIGYGLLQEDPDTKLSYFGLGLMSIFQLGRRVKVFTRPQDEDQIILLEVDTGDIFDEDQDKKKRSISELRFSLGHADELTRRKATPPKLNDHIQRKYLGQLSGSFTEIVIEDIKPEVLDQLCSSAFLDEFRKQLPLKPEKDEPFLRYFKGTTVSRVKRIITDEEYCKTIDVYFGIQEEEDELSQLWKYFPRFRSDLEFPEDNVYRGKSKDGGFEYYIVHTVAEDLHRRHEDSGDQAASERENGFWVRNQNFLVKAADFLQKPGGGRPLMDQPLRAWIFGEIFHKDMNRFLTVARNDYLYEKPEFLDFREQVYGIVKQLNRELRDIWKQKQRIVDGFVEPFIAVTKSDGVLGRAEKRLKKMVGSTDEKSFHEIVLKRLRAARKKAKTIENKGACIDEILRKTRGPITLGEDDKSLVRVDPALNGRVDTYKIAWDNKTKRVVVSVSPNLFDPKDVRFLGRTFKVLFVAQKEGDYGISVDVDGGEIFINPFNEHLAEYSVSILDVYLCLEIADAISQDKKELKKNVLDLLGLRPPGEANYVRPLGDDLRRTLALSLGRR